MALILNLETATTNCSVSLAKDGKLISIKEHNETGYSHSENLHVFISECLKNASLLPNDLDAVAVSKGPGSYTGLRIGVSAAKGLCFALDIPLIAISTLRCMVEQLNVGEGFIIPMLDARRLEVYSAVFDKERKEIRNTRAEIITPDSFEDYVKEGPVYLAGSGATKCIDILKHPNFVFEENVIPSSKDLAVLSYESFINKEFENNAYFEPDYLKKFVSNLSK
ncbi:tRNA (adenosine(37)-N6)-threonylcarbamoyltransferase complex dimerization subunit type 1 TsaB [Eudoraea sp.]|uniref:tRNA (adenosine(37)-N6)-threonylcarbamoyltransferase complex dimerization subunit type 1 TsaB n=1 Tax=Eudoraea sp. TaxID=1979955 RepID=UPI003C725CB3